METKSKSENIRDLYRGIKDLRKGYQPTTDRVKDEKSDLVTDSHSISARWKNHFTQLLNVHGVYDVWQTETHTAKPSVPKPSAFEFQMATEKLKRHKSPGTDQIPAEFITSGSNNSL